MNLLNSKSFVIYNFFRHKSTYFLIFMSLIIYSFIINFSYLWLDNFKKNYSEIELLEESNSVNVIAKNEKSQITTEQLNAIQNELRKHEKYINYVSMRIKLQGVVENKKESIIFDGIGIEPLKEKKIFSKRFEVTDGNFLEDFEQDGVLITQKIADELNLKVGDEVYLSVRNHDKYFFIMQNREFSTVNLYVQGIVSDLKNPQSSIVIMPFYPAGKLLYSSSISEVLINFTSEQAERFAIQEITENIENIKIDKKLNDSDFEVNTEVVKRNEDDSILEDLEDAEIIETEINEDTNTAVTTINKNILVEDTQFVQNLSIEDKFEAFSSNPLASNLSVLWIIFAIILFILLSILVHFAILLLFYNRKEEIQTLFFYNWSFSQIFRLFGFELFMFNFFVFLINFVLILFFSYLLTALEIQIPMFFIEANFKFENNIYQMILINSVVIAVWSFVTSIISLFLLKNKLQEKEN